jgi:hypothetical protein
VSTLLEDAPTTTALEATEETPEEEPSNLLHIYCSPCLQRAYPGRILPYCGTKRPRNDDEMRCFVKEAPPHELCVVCLDFPHCPTCGAR